MRQLEERPQTQIEKKREKECRKEERSDEKKCDRKIEYDGQERCDTKMGSKTLKLTPVLP